MKSKQICLLALFLCATMLLGACSRLNTLDFKDEEYIDKKNNVTYLQASLCYEAARIVDNGGVARIKHRGMDEIVLYQIDGIDTKSMLANDQYEIFYAKGTTLPKLWEMGVNEIHICQTQSITVELASITEAGDVAALIAAYQTGAAFPVSNISKELADARYYLKFASPTYPSLYYSLEYLEFSEEICVYQPIADKNSFEILYDGVEVTTETNVYETNGERREEHLAVYHFGNGVLYDRMAGLCYAAGDIVATYLG